MSGVDEQAQGSALDYVCCCIRYGRSLGSGLSCYMAEKQSAINRPMLGLILQSPLLSAFRVAFHFRHTLPGDVFPNIDRAPNITGTPVLIIHGTKDEVVPLWHGQVSLPASCCRCFKFW